MEVEGVQAEQRQVFCCCAIFGVGRYLIFGGKRSRDLEGEGKGGMS
jgi:hypothetical protein